MTAQILLILLFFLSIASLLTLKTCSGLLDRRTAPLFISAWTLGGAIAVFPVFGPLWRAGVAVFAVHPLYAALALAKGGLLYLLFVVSQDLMKESLSSRHYVTPLAAGLIAIVNHFLGEVLTARQWASALGLCVVSGAFFLKGHLSELSKEGKRAYVKLVCLSVIVSAIDHVVTKDVNWYALLLTSYATLGCVSLFLHHRNVTLLKSALLTRPAIMAGAVYAATELIKFYQMVTINPVTVIATVQAATKPVILACSALVWKERSLKEQLAWGVLAFAFVVLPYIF